MIIIISTLWYERLTFGNLRGMVTHGRFSAIRTRETIFMTLSVLSFTPSSLKNGSSLKGMNLPPSGWTLAGTHTHKKRKIERVAYLTGVFILFKHMSEDRYTWRILSAFFKGRIFWETGSGLLSKGVTFPNQDVYVEGLLPLQPSTPHSTPLEQILSFERSPLREGGKYFAR